MLKPTPEDIKEENRRMRELGRLIDRAVFELRSGSHSYDSSRRLIEQTRQNVVDLFPDKGYLFDLIYRPRFHRILDENFITI